LIFFKVPLEGSILFCENIHPETKHEELKDIFGNFGLLYEIKVFQLPGKSTDYAFIKYYSRKAATLAFQKANKLKLHGIDLKLTFAKQRQGRKETPLDINRCIELANYYIGFNCWSSNIMSLSQESLELNETNGSFKCTYTCKTTFRLLDSRFIEATGKASNTSNDKRFAIEYAKKNAVTDARKNAFQQIVLIELIGGKVAVHFLNDSLEFWEKKEETTKK